MGKVMDLPNQTFCTQFDVLGVARAEPDYIMMSREVLDNKAEINSVLADRTL
jgi:hypothetical protein